MKLSTRLSLFFLGTTTLLLVGFSATLYGLASKYLHRQADERLEAALNTLVAAAEVNEAGVEWEPEERKLSFGRRTVEGQFLWVVCDDRGRRIDGSDPDPAPLPPAMLSRQPEGRPRSFADRQGRPWRLMVRRLAASRARGGGDSRARSRPEPGAARTYETLVIGAAVSLSGVREAIANLGILLAALSAGTWLAALFVGGRLSRPALRPVAEMAEAARSIGGDEVGRRLPEPRSGDELEELGRAFNGLLDRLHEAHERQRRFTGDASHQLRTPLTAMQGQVDLALRQERSGEEYRRVLGVVQRRTRHLRRIVEALLFLARADAEAERPALEVLDLDDWLPGHLRCPHEGPRTADVRLVVEPGGPHRVRAQAALLGELVDNLIDNAVKYGEPGTPVLVRLERGGRGVQVCVEDRGMGIDRDEIPRLFDPFYRTEAARRRGAAGIGLGLSVASRLAGLFGGAIRAESRPGLGSKFTIDLPAVGRGPADEASTGVEAVARTKV